MLIWDIKIINKEQLVFLKWINVFILIRILWVITFTLNIYTFNNKHNIEDLIYITLVISTWNIKNRYINTITPQTIFHQY